MKAKYIFRGYDVMVFDLPTKKFEITKDAVMCSFIKADLNLMRDFIDDCLKYTNNEITEVKTIEVD